MAQLIKKFQWINLGLGALRLIVFAEEKNKNQLTKYK